MKDVYRPCPICDSINIENIRRISFSMDGIMPDSYFLAKCEDCGFLYANTVATLQDYERYYAENNRYSNIPNQASATIKTYEKISNLLCKYINKDDSILDIGCGSGDMLKLMKTDGYKCLTGMDPAQASIDKLSESGIYGIRGTIYDKPIIGCALGEFDTIILGGVLEHLHDLKKAVRNIRSYIKESGKLFVIVPNTLEYSHYSFPLAHYINIEHINHFTPNSLIQLFAENGFSLQDCINTTINFGRPDPVLIAVFEYISVKDIAYRKINAMLLHDDVEQTGLITSIDNLVVSKKRIAIWGTGNFARSLIANTNLSKANIICFLDNDTSLHNKSFCGYKVNPPSFISEFDGDILILSMHAFTEIEDQIRNMGFASKIIYY